MMTKYKCKWKSLQTMAIWYLKIKTVCMFRVLCLARKWCGNRIINMSAALNWQSDINFVIILNEFSFISFFSLFDLLFLLLSIQLLCSMWIFADTFFLFYSHTSLITKTLLLLLFICEHAMAEIQLKRTRKKNWTIEKEIIY